MLPIFQNRIKEKILVTIITNLAFFKLEINLYTPTLCLFFRKQPVISSLNLFLIAHYLEIKHESYMRNYFSRCKLQ